MVESMWLTKRPLSIHQPKMRGGMAAGGSSMVVKMAKMLHLVTLVTLICVANGNITVQITNMIEYDKVLIIGCRSSDNDLGQHTLLYGQSMDWRFKPNFSKTTLFYCNARWDAADVTLKVHFVAYEYTRDNYGCGSDCRWLFTISGVYAYDSKNDSWEFRFSWYS
uniref:self-incompatibility protein S1-like n=1 Tax=Erigeron canadensis TaxID=72917 RepID=UPI001CB926EC|nr:self-incompatibility protein S1-like [Erigeron canadensis]